MESVPPFLDPEDLPLIETTKQFFSIRIKKSHGDHAAEGESYSNQNDNTGEQ